VPAPEVGNARVMQRAAEVGSSFVGFGTLASAAA
jgi:hypothetical protein